MGFQSEPKLGFPNLSLTFAISPPLKLGFRNFVMFEIGIPGFLDPHFQGHNIGILVYSRTIIVKIVKKLLCPQITTKSNLGQARFEVDFQMSTWQRYPVVYYCSILCYFLYNFSHVIGSRNSHCLANESGNSIF